jgi:hypothetical protein
MPMSSWKGAVCARGQTSGGLGMSKVKRYERGQTLPLLVVFMVSLLGMSGLAIDVGSWYQVKRHMQSEADAAALAGASQIPAGWSSAQTAAASEFAKNARPGESATYANTTYLTSGDSVSVTVTGHATGFFTSVLGFSGANISVSARGTVESFQTVRSNADVMPWGVMKDTYTPGQNYPIYTDNSSSNNGALSLPYIAGANCPVPSGANPYRDEIDGALNSCPVSVTEQLSVKPGDNSGPTRQGLDARITNWQTANQIVSFTNGGRAQVLNSSSPQLVLIPVVEDPNGGTNWLNGAGWVRVVGFAWFIISNEQVTGQPGPGYTNNGKTVNGIFVGLEDSTTVGDTTGAWTPGYQGDWATALTS